VKSENSRSQNKKYRIGITGGIASGKTFATTYFKNRGFTVFFADQLAAEIMNNDPEIISSIVSEFGKDSYLDGRLNRAYLAAAVFGSPEKVQKLNAIVHPAVVKQSDLLLKKELERNDLVFYEAALIFEAGMTERIDYILLITADVKVRVSRALARGGISEDEIRKRISSQISEEEKINRSHFVIINNGTQEELREKLNNFLQFLLKGEAEKLHQFPHFFK